MKILLNKEYNSAVERRWNVTNEVVVCRCLQEFTHGTSLSFIFGFVLYYTLVIESSSSSVWGDESSSYSSSGIAAYLLLMQEIQHCIRSLRFHVDLWVREYPDISRFLTLMKEESLIENPIVDEEDNSNVDRDAEATEQMSSQNKEVEDCLNLENNPKSKKDLNTTGGIGIEFRDVHFEYPSRPGQKVLKGLNLRIEPNMVTWVVGDSGAGKSTLSKLILRLYDPIKGGVYITNNCAEDSSTTSSNDTLDASLNTNNTESNDKDIKVDYLNLKDVNLKSFRSKIGVVNQSPSLFNCSLAENIAYGKQDKKQTDDFSNKNNSEFGNNIDEELDLTIDDEKVQEAAKLWNCVEFVDKLRAGFDTFAGSGGSQLSGGQKQRIWIARAAIRNPELLILDEATSALDWESEKLVQEALEKFTNSSSTNSDSNKSKKRTTLIVAHRLSTIRCADKIICMKDGKLVEEGTHDSLMWLKGSYFNLVNKQTNFSDDESSENKEKSKSEDKDSTEDKEKSKSASEEEEDVII